MPFDPLDRANISPAKILLIVNMFVNLVKLGVGKEQAAEHIAELLNGK